MGSLYTTYSRKWWTDQIRILTTLTIRIALALALSGYAWYLVNPVHSELQSGVDYLVLIVTLYCCRLQ